LQSFFYSFKNATPVLVQVTFQPRKPPGQLSGALATLAGHYGSGYNLWMRQVSSNVRVKVLFFGRVRELAGYREETEELPAGTTLNDLFERYTKRIPSLAGFRSSLVASRNQEFAAWDTQLAEGDEIAFLPPVSGG
jgi:molybdopterin synthase sulfur carrier subunit